MPSYTYYIGKFIHSISLSTLQIFNGVICVEDKSGKIKTVACEYAVTEDSDLHCYGREAEVLDALKKLNLDAEDAEALILAVLKRDRRDTTVYVAKTGQFFFPGFIDTHIHACQYPNSGLFGQKALLDWLKEYTFPTEQRLSDPSVAKRVYERCISRTLSNGTTCAAYYATTDRDSTNILAQICFDKGQRAFVGRCNMDMGMDEGEPIPCPKGPDPNALPPYHDASVEAALRDTELCINYVQKMDPSFNLIKPILTPRFAVNCSAELLGGIGKRAEEGLEMGQGYRGRKTNLPCQTHIAENKKEYQEVMERFQKIDPTIDSYAHVYEKYGLLRKDMILAHAVHLREEDIKRIANTDAKVAHCPISNMALLSGNAKVRKMLESDITVGLGTDHAGGYSPSMLEVVRDTTMVSRIVAVEEEDGPEGGKHLSKLSVSEALHLATVGGAKVMGMENKVGCFKEGFEWDACLIGLEVVPKDEGSSKEGVKTATVGGDVGPVDLFGWEKPLDIVEKWVYSGDDRNFLKVWVQGRLVHEKPFGGCKHCH